MHCLKLSKLVNVLRCIPDFNPSIGKTTLTVTKRQRGILRLFTDRKLFQIRACVLSARKAKHLDATTMFRYSHTNTPLLGQSERAYCLSYFIKYRQNISITSLCLCMCRIARELNLSSVMVLHKGVCSLFIPLKLRSAVQKFLLLTKKRQSKFFCLLLKETSSSLR